ncbi:MAG: hypothetical protein ABL933_05450 [Methyloglobulus sp.]|nr:hypothetical protein [Methyloglobulus sp.]
MPISVVLESCFKWLFLLSTLTMGVLYFYKDKLPEPGFYDLVHLEEPSQFATDHEEFKTRVDGHEYTITPKFDYELYGVVVSYNNSDSFGDIWHRKRWLDFINQRDLCVIWGKNVETGVYKRMKFSNDSWTCWAFWPDSEVGNLFKMNALSNNHLLVDNEAIKLALMASEPGDHIRFKGLLAEYANKENGFFRGTSTIREDTGNGACETVYLTEFEVVKKANPKLRRFYAVAKGLSAITLFGFLVMFCIAPARFK